MRLIELHIIQSFPVSCLNRDDVGAPKTAVFGGVTRARISSQCLKRAIRKWAKEENATAFKGSRTLKAADVLAKDLTDKYSWSLEDARTIADAVCHLFLSKSLPKVKKGKTLEDDDQPASNEQTSTLLYFSPDEIKKLAAAIDATKKDKPNADPKTLKDAAAKALGKTLPKDAADIAIFGRMVAAAPDLTLEGAGMFSHALSTHKCENDIDFWTAVDDEKKASEDAGAANMGTLEFTSATYYRYAALNLDMLKEHLQPLDVENQRQIVDTFLRATMLALPDKGRKNSMNAWVVPSYVLGIVKEKGQPIQLVNAFEKPVWSKDGLIEASVKAMQSHHDALKKTWNIEIKAEVEIPPSNLNAFCSEMVKHVV